MSIVSFEAGRERILQRRAAEQAQMAERLRAFALETRDALRAQSEENLISDAAWAASYLVDMATGTYEVLNNQVLSAKQWQTVAQITAEMAREIALAVGLSHCWQQVVRRACVDALMLPLFPEQALRVAEAQIARLQRSPKLDTRWKCIVEESLKAIRTADVIYVATATEQFGAVMSKTA